MSRNRNECFLLIPHKEERKILVKRRDTAWNLPTLILPDSFPRESFDIINHHTAQQLKITGNTLRCLHDHSQPGDQPCHRIYVVEIPEADHKIPPEFLWMGPDEFTTLTAFSRELEEVVKNWFSQNEGVEEGSFRTTCWYQQNWYEDAYSWVYSQLAKLDLTPTGPLRKTHISPVRFTAEIPTRDNLVLFKAIPHKLIGEILLTNYLFLKYPDYFPKIVSIHLEKPWILEIDPGKETLAPTSDDTLMEEVLRLYSSLQVEMTGNLNTLRYLNIPEHNLKIIPDQIDELLNDKEALGENQPGGLTTGEIKKVKAIAPVIKARFRELAHCDIPLSIEHGCFEPGAIIIHQGNYLFTRWSEAVISCPLFSLARFLNSLSENTPQLTEESKVNRLRKVYLEKWTCWEPMERLGKALDYAGGTVDFHQALTWYLHIMPMVEFNRKTRHIIPSLLRRAIRKTAGISL